MGIEEKGLTPVERDVLAYVQAHQPVTVRQVAEAMATERGIARTTVLTHMERLRQKRFLSRHAVNGVNHYRATRSPEEVTHGLVADFVQGALGGSLAPLVVFMTERAHLSDEERCQLEQIVEKIEKEN